MVVWGRRDHEYEWDRTTGEVGSAGERKEEQMSGAKQVSLDFGSLTRSGFLVDHVCPA